MRTAADTSLTPSRVPAHGSRRWRLVKSYLLLDFHQLPCCQLAWRSHLFSCYTPLGHKMNVPGDPHLPICQLQSLDRGHIKNVPSVMNVAGGTDQTLRRELKVTIERDGLCPGTLIQMYQKFIPSNEMDSLGTMLERVPSVMAAANGRWGLSSKP